VHNKTKQKQNKTKTFNKKRVKKAHEFLKFFAWHKNPRKQKTPNEHRELMHTCEHL
jgi:hypothetical protein